LLISALSLKSDYKGFINPVFADVENNVKSFGLALYVLLELIQGLTESNGCAVVGCGHQQWLIADAIIAPDPDQAQWLV